MEDKAIITAATALVKKDFELEGFEDFLSEAELLQALSEHIAYMLESQLENLLSTLYRMDVSEEKVSLAIRPDAPLPANVGIAQLILDRQKQRVFTKHYYKQTPTTDWFDF